MPVARCAQGVLAISRARGPVARDRLQPVTGLEVTHVTPVAEAHQTELQVSDHRSGLGPRP